jgi:16S rRNA processing protein RimM
MTLKVKDTTRPDDLIELGRVLGAHGIKGWVKIQPFSSDSSALASASNWWLADPQSPLAPNDAQVSNFIPAPVVWARSHGNFFLASLKNTIDRDGAEALKGQRIFVSRAVFPKLEKDEYYWVDLIGCRVTTSESGEIAPLGVVDSIIENPAHSILSVRQQTVGDDGVWCDRLDAKGKPINTLIPFVAAHVQSVSLTERIIATDWPRDF